MIPEFDPMTFTGDDLAAIRRGREWRPSEGEIFREKHDAAVAAGVELPECREVEVDDWGGGFKVTTFTRRGETDEQARSRYFQWAFAHRPGWFEQGELF